MKRLEFSRGSRLPLALVLVLAAILAAGVALAQEAAIKDMVVANSHTGLLLYLTVDDAFTPEMEEGIRNGIPVTFTFYVELLQKRKDSPDKLLVSRTFDHVLSYDSLKDEYQVKLKEKAGRLMASKTLAEARRTMTEINGLEVTPLDQLTLGSLYGVRVKVRLAKRTLPLNIHYLVPFWGAGDFETEFRQVEFVY